MTISEVAKRTPSKSVPDGAITGNGDVVAILGGNAEKVRIHIGKSDFWKSDWRGYVDCLGGLAPLGTVEILLPHLAYADYKAEQNIDKGFIKLSLKTGKFDATVKITVCATQNTVIIELDHTHRFISSSISLFPVEGADAITEQGSTNDVNYVIRGFDTPECRFPTYGICALRKVSSTVYDGRVRTVWAMNVCTNHDSAAYKMQAIESVGAIDEAMCQKLLAKHSEWWRQFWSKSSVQLSDDTLELYWYIGLYANACCARNKKFPPGLYGYSTSDGMLWFGDYHLNYNYEAAFYAFASSNHTELMECYSTPLNDFLPIAKHYAKKYLGISGAYYPVSIGPLGMETDYRPDTKEHGHLFLGQKSNGAYASVIPMMHWYSTRDTEFAKREYYDFLLSVAEFWENYLIFEDGAYQIYNDALNEVEWYIADCMPQGHDDKNSTLSCGLVRMLMKMIIDISKALGENLDKIPKWQHILDNLAPIETFEKDGTVYLRGIAGSDVVREVSIDAMYPAGAIGKYTTPKLFEAVKNSHKYLQLWDSHNRFCSYYPLAARLEYPPEELISRIHANIANHGLSNGMFAFDGGGLESNSAIPSTLNEMLLQSYEGIVRLFPVWDKKQDASFSGLRAFGAFLVNATLKNGVVYAEIFSEKGMPLTLEAPGNGYVLKRADGTSIPISEGIITVDTKQGETVFVTKEN
ncbi:MAG: hypothetical protein IKB51_04235 [Clostridia bacterium]|nr:hypothetical protein [Clostridia bacterium]